MLGPQHSGPGWHLNLGRCPERGPGFPRWPVRSAPFSVRRREQAAEEVVQERGEPQEHGRRSRRAVAAVDLVSGEPQLSVGRGHDSVTRRVGAAAAVGVVLHAVQFQDDPASAGEQQQEILSAAGASSPGSPGIRVIVEVDLRDKHGDTEPVRGVPDTVALENDSFRCRLAVDFSSRSYKSLPAARSSPSVRSSWPAHQVTRCRHVKLSSVSRDRHRVIRDPANDTFGVTPRP